MAYRLKSRSTTPGAAALKAETLSPVAGYPLESVVRRGSRFGTAGTEYTGTFGSAAYTPGAAPVVERIALLVKATLEAITVAAGYAFTAGTVTRPERKTLDPPTPLVSVPAVPATDRPCPLVLSQEDPLPVPELWRSGNPPRRGWRVRFWVSLCFRPAQGAAWDPASNGYVAEVARALLADPQWTEPATAAKLAVNSEIGELNTLLDARDGALAGVDLALDVEYTTAKNDPYALR